MFIHVLKEICASAGYYWSSIICENIENEEKKV
jgi:hypothetical protein